MEVHVRAHLNSLQQTISRNLDYTSECSKESEGHGIGNNGDLLNSGKKLTGAIVCGSVESRTF